MDAKKYILLVLVICEVAYAYKILVVSPMPGKSHSILGDALVKHLALAGHEISYVTAYPPAKPEKNIQIVDVSRNTKLLDASKMLDLKTKLEKKLSLIDILSHMEKFSSMNKQTLTNPNVLKLMQDKSQHFDLVIAEWMFMGIYSGLSAVFNCPLIWFSSVEPHWKILRLIDGSPNPAYTSDIHSGNIPPFTFTERVMELGLQIFGQLLDKFQISRLDNEIYESILVPIIQERGHIAPSLDILKYNASMVIGNSHVSLGLPSRLPDSYKSIGGYHIDTNVKPLPQDLQNLLDNAKHGVIYFSLGSNIKSKTLPDEVKDSLKQMFGELKQTVLWKFEEDLPDRPKNLHIVQWAPQHSILAHNNCVLFITHGGRLSTAETVHFGVPIIGIPVFADQFINVGTAVKKGYAKRVDLSYTMASDLKKAIGDILTDPSYKQKVKELSFIYHDRPVSPAEELVHWVQHVVRTGGAPHLRSPALMVPWYQTTYLDLIALLIFVILVLKYSIKMIRDFLKKQKKEEKKKNN